MEVIGLLREPTKSPSGQKKLPNGLPSYVTMCSGLQLSALKLANCFQQMSSSQT
jgi:hypothetical protein